MFPARDLLTELKPSIAELRAIDLRSSHQFEEEIGNASSANRLLFHKTEFSVWTAISSSSRYERANADQAAPGVDNCARTGKKIVEHEPRQIGFIQVLSDPMEVCRNQASRYEPAVRNTGAASAHRSRNAEFGPFGLHC
jgi:hypothetical protein